MAHYTFEASADAGWSTTLGRRALPNHNSIQNEGISMKAAFPTCRTAGSILILGAIVSALAIQTATAAKAPSPVSFQNPAILYGKWQGNAFHAICLANSTGTRSEELLTPGRNQNFIGPYWSPDGAQIAFVCLTKDYTKTVAIVETSVCLANADGTGYRKLAVAREHEQLIGWLPVPGERILLLAVSHPPSLRTLNADTGALLDQPVPGYTPNSYPSFSPDLLPDPGYQGFAILSVYTGYTENDPWLPDLWRYSVNEINGTLTFTEPTQLTFTPDLAEVYPQVSPDGVWVAFAYPNIDNPAYPQPQTLNLMAVTGGPVVAIADASLSAAGSWSPDQKYVAFFSTIEYHVLRASIDGSRPLWDLTPRDDFAGDCDWNPNWVNDID